MVLVDGFFLVIVGFEDGGVKVFLVFSDFEKLGILGEGMFSFDLDRIFIEGEVVIRIRCV